MPKYNLGKTDDYKPLASSRSPQSARGTAQDYEQFTKGDVNLGMKNPTKNGDAGNAGASKLHEERKPYKPLYEPEVRK